MKYEAPELTALMPAINAVQTVAKSQVALPHDSIFDYNESSASYVDWE